MLYSVIIKFAGVVTKDSYVFDPGRDFRGSIMLVNMSECSMDSPKLPLILLLCNGTNWTLSYEDPEPFYSLTTTCKDKTTMTTDFTIHNISDEFDGSQIIIDQMSALLPNGCLLLFKKAQTENETGNDAKIVYYYT